MDDSIYFRGNNSFIIGTGCTTSTYIPNSAGFDDLGCGELIHDTTIENVTEKIGAGGDNVENVEFDVYDSEDEINAEDLKFLDEKSSSFIKKIDNTSKYSDNRSAKTTQLFIKKILTK